MLQTFLATLQPMCVLFVCIAIGFILHKRHLLPDNAGKVMAKLETWVFCPALSFSTMVRFCTIDRLSEHASNILIACVHVTLALVIAIPCSKLFIKEKVYERNVYQYALAFGNIGYMGDPIVQALFGDVGLSYYKFYTLPLSIVIYIWGINILVPKEHKNGNPIKSILTAPMVAMLTGIILGLIGLGGTNGFLDTNLTFFMKTCDTLKACMGPVAMLLLGFTMATYDFKAMLKKKKVYVATFLRLIVIPVVIITVLFLFKELLNLIFALNLTNNVLFLALFAVATPLGMNTVVFPEAFGGNPETGASMATISHTLCVITIPLMFALMSLIFPVPIF